MQSTMIAMGCVGGKGDSAEVYESWAAAKSPRLNASPPFLRCVAEEDNDVGDTDGTALGGA